MRRHGWGGDMPVDDDQARERIVAVARVLIDEHPDRVPSISEVADRLSVTRQTVYRYFPSTQALLVASVSSGIDAFLADITAHLAGTCGAADAVVEGIAFTYEQIHDRPALALLVRSGSGPAHEVTSPTSLLLGRSILDRLPVDWDEAGLSGDDLDELVERMLRTLQSLIIDPGSPPRTPPELRRFLHRWIGPSVQAGAVAPAS